MRSARKSPPGAQSLVEFALILPVFLLFVMVIFDLGRVVFYYSAIHNGAREGARRGIIVGADGSVDVNDTLDINAAVTRLTAGLDQSGLSIAISDPSVFTETIQVTVDYTFIPVTPIIAALLDSGSNDITLSSSATMQLEK